MQQSKHMACTPNFTRVSYVCHVLRITLFSWCALQWQVARATRASETEEGPIDDHCHAEQCFMFLKKLISVCAPGRASLS